MHYCKKYWNHRNKQCYNPQVQKARVKEWHKNSKRHAEKNKLFIRQNQIDAVKSNIDTVFQ